MFFCLDRESDFLLLKMGVENDRKIAAIHHIMNKIYNDQCILLNVLQCLHSFW